MSAAWAIWLRRLNVAAIVLLLPTGAVGFAALIAGPQNTAFVSVIPPQYSVTDFAGTEIHTAWVTVFVALAWLVVLASAPGPWGDSGRCVLLLALATGSWLGPEPFWAVSYVLIIVGGCFALFGSVFSVRGVVVFLATSVWLFAGLVGWFLTTPPGWLVLLIMPLCAPLGAWLERSARRGPRALAG